MAWTGFPGSAAPVNHARVAAKDLCMNSAADSPVRLRFHRFQTRGDQHILHRAVDGDDKRIPVGAMSACSNAKVREGESSSGPVRAGIPGSLCDSAC